MKRTITILFITILFVCCKKDKTSFVDCNLPTTNINLCKELIIGHWTWSYEKYYNRRNQSYVIKTPISEGYTKEIKFNNSGIALIYKNSSLERKASYAVTTLDKVTGVTGDNTITTLIFYDMQTGQRFDFTPITICSDTLTFNYQSYSDTKGQLKWAKN